MRKIVILTSVACLFLCTSFVAHKYYLSVTDIAYNKEEASLQMITRLFYDDLEAVLRERYSKDITVDATSNQEELDIYIKKYLNAKVKIIVNGKEKTLSYLGKRYDDDFVVCYIEITGVSSIKTLEIENTVLMDAFSDQKNMIHTDILGKKKSLLLVDGKANAVLNFSE